MTEGTLAGVGLDEVRRLLNAWVVQRPFFPAPRRRILNVTIDASAARDPFPTVAVLSLI